MGFSKHHILACEAYLLAPQVLASKVSAIHSRPLFHGWQSLGLTPGAVVRFVSHQPLDDLFEVEVAGRRVPLGSEGLEGLLGERLPDEACGEPP